MTTVHYCAVIASSQPVLFVKSSCERVAACVTIVIPTCTNSCVCVCVHTNTNTYHTPP
jgi:hypothetical protein